MRCASQVASEKWVLPPRETLDFDGRPRLQKIGVNPRALAMTLTGVVKRWRFWGPRPRRPSKTRSGTKRDLYRLCAASMAGFRAPGMPWSQARPSLPGLRYDFGASGNLETAAPSTPFSSALDSSFCVHSLAISSNVSRCASLAASSAQRRHSSALRLHSSIVGMLAPRCDSRATRSLTICSWATDRTALLPATRRPSHPVWLNRRSANCAMDQTKTGLSLVALRRGRPS